MEHPIKRLADAISTSEKKFAECQKLMAGESYFDYFLRTTEETT